MKLYAAVSVLLIAAMGIVRGTVLGLIIICSLSVINSRSMYKVAVSFFIDARL